MRFYSAVVLDDDKDDLESLKELLLSSRYASALRLSSVASTEELATLVAQGQDIDILFADIHLSGVQGAGIDAVAKLFAPGCPTQVIYVSGYLEQATEVYETQHVYFLSKPVDPRKLDAALGRAVEAIEHQARRYLEVKVGRSVACIELSSVLYIESSLRKAHIHVFDRPEAVVVYRRLEELQQDLPEAFVRCHGSFIVNLAHVTRLSATACTLDDGSEVPVSRSRGESVRQAFAEYLHRRL